MLVDRISNCLSAQLRVLGRMHTGAVRVRPSYPDHQPRVCPMRREHFLDITQRRLVHGTYGLRDRRIPDDAALGHEQPHLCVMRHGQRIHHTAGTGILHVVDNVCRWHESGSGWHGVLGPHLYRVHW